MKSCFNNAKYVVDPETSHSFDYCFQLKNKLRVMVVPTDNSFSTQLCVIYRHSFRNLQPRIMAFKIEVSNCLFVMEPS